MTNPAIVGMLSKVENQQRERQVAHIQQLNLADKSREKPPGKARVFKAQIAKIAKRLFISKSASKSPNLSRPGERIRS